VKGLTFQRHHRRRCSAQAVYPQRRERRAGIPGNHGPLGFPVVDLAVTLTNGSYHNVDSSDQAFKSPPPASPCRKGLLKCSPLLLEPVVQVEVSVPTSFYL
jgi:hypothetical protein